jgi:hypothetical protein
MNALPPGGLNQTGKDAVGLQAAFGSGSKKYFTEDDQMTDGLFGMVVRRRDPGVTEKGEEVSLILTRKKGSQSFGGLEIQRFFTDIEKSLDKMFFNAFRRFPGELSGFQFCCCFAGSLKECFHLTAEFLRCSLLLRFRQ